MRVSNKITYLKALQREYLVAKLRLFIYPEKDSSYYNRVLKGKKEKIKNISLKEGCQNIFNSENIFKRYINLLYNTGGFPNFNYRDESLSIMIKDFYNYYKKGIEIRFFYDNVYYEGRVISCNFEQELVIIADRDDRKFILDKTEVFRPLPSLLKFVKEI